MEKKQILIISSNKNRFYRFHKNVVIFVVVEGLDELRSRLSIIISTLFAFERVIMRPVVCWRKKRWFSHVQKYTQLIDNLQ